MKRFFFIIFLAHFHLCFAQNSTIILSEFGTYIWQDHKILWLSTEDCGVVDIIGDIVILSPMYGNGFFIFNCQNKQTSEIFGPDEHAMRAVSNGNSIFVYTQVTKNGIKFLFKYTLLPDSTTKSLENIFYTVIYARMMDHIEPIHITNSQYMFEFQNEKIDIILEKINLGTTKLEISSGGNGILFISIYDAAGFE